MDLSADILGKHIADQLQDRIASPVLRIGRDEFDRQSLSAVACFNYSAASNLTAILNKELMVKDTKDVYQNIKPRDLALPRLGAVALAVLGAAFELRGLGGDAPLRSWCQKHASKDEHLTTFGTIKGKIAATTRNSRRRRKAAR